jgi:subtilisin family serine protease
MRNLFYALIMWSALQAPAHAGDVLVAVVDSAINESLPRLKPRLTLGKNFLGARNEKPDFDDHATAVTSILLEMAPRISVMPIAVTHKGVASSLDVIDALVYAIDGGAHIINLSISMYDEALMRVRDRVGEARFLRVVLVIAAGNFREHYERSAEAWPNVIVVAALSRKNPCALASYSAYGPGIDIAAPAGDSNDGLRAINYFGVERQFNGSSAAVPVVAGLIAELKEKNPSFDGAMLKQLLLSQSGTCDGLMVADGKFISSDMLKATLLR